MDQIPALFTESVLSLLRVCLNKFDLPNLARLNCRLWDEQNFTRPTSCSLFIYPLESNSQEISYKFTVNDKRTRLEDFREQNAIMWNVDLGWPTFFSGDVRYLPQATCDDAFIARLKWILARQGCVFFRCYLNPEAHEELLARLLSAIPHSFLSIDIEFSSELAENFILETSKHQQIKELRLQETRKYGARLDQLVNRMFLCPATHFLQIEQYHNPFTLQTFETLIERWIANPERWTCEFFGTTVPIDFDPQSLNKYVKHLTTGHRDYFARKVSIGGHIMELFYYPSTRCCRIMLSRPAQNEYSLFLSRAEEAYHKSNRPLGDFVF